MAKLSFNLEDKVFVVTGGSRGIGFEITRMLLDQKARVAICSRKQEGLDAAAAELNVGAEDGQECQNQKSARPEQEQAAL